MLMNIPFGGKKKKKLGEKEGGTLTTTANNCVSFSSNIYFSMLHQLQKASTGRISQENTLNIIIFPLNVILGSLVQMVQVRLLFCFCFCFCFFLSHSFPIWIVYLYSYCWPITASRGFCDKCISSNFYITLGGSWLFFHCACTVYGDIKHLEN